MAAKTILIVEDEGIIALAMEKILEKEGYRICDIFFSGEQVIPFLEKAKKPDLILLDIGFGGSISGIDVARQIREKFSIPLIFVTAYTSEKILHEMNEVAPTGVIHKPFVSDDLLELVQKTIG
nr:response regulator [uncultured Methanoregula sp.]